MEADEGDGIAFDVVGGGHEVGDGNASGPPEADILLRLPGAARGIVDRVEIEFNRRHRACTRRVFEDVIKPGEAVKVGA